MSTKENGKTETGRDFAYQELRRLIICSGLQPGQLLVENDWAERLGVHRGAVRESLAILYHEGLLAKEGRSFSVPILSEDDIREIYEVRQALEISAIRICANRTLSEKNIQGLEKLCEVMEHLLKANLFIGYSEADEKFHNELILLAGNSRLTKVYQLAPLPHSKFGGELPAAQPEIFEKAQSEHQAIVDAFKKGCPLEAVPIIEEHLNYRLRKTRSSQSSKAASVH